MLWNCKPENVGICKINGQRVLFYIIFSSFNCKFGFIKKLILFLFKCSLLILHESFFFCFKFYFTN